jgi:hypothetical protein
MLTENAIVVVAGKQHPGAWTEERARRLCIVELLSSYQLTRDDAVCMYVYIVFMQAAILQHAVEFIVRLKREKTRLSSENENLMKMLGVQPPMLSSLAGAVSCDAAAAAAAVLPHRNRHAVAAAAEDEMHYPPMKRVRLDNDSSSYSSSSSSISSDEGGAELSSPWTATNASGDRSTTGGAGSRARPLQQQAAGERSKSSSASGCESTARRRRRMECDRSDAVDVADCKPKLATLVAAGASDCLMTATNGDVQNYGSSLKPEPTPSRGVTVKQVLTDRPRADPSRFDAVYERRPVSAFSFSIRRNSIVALYRVRCRSKAN